MATSEWFFFRDLSGAWHWERRDATGKPIKESYSGFLTMETCVADAVQNGYVSTSASPPASRQREIGKR